MIKWTLLMYANIHVGADRRRRYRLKCNFFCVQKICERWSNIEIKRQGILFIIFFSSRGDVREVNGKFYYVSDDVNEFLID